MNIVS